MKLHDNSRFGWRFVVTVPRCNCFKTNRFIELLGLSIRLPDLQKHGAMELFQGIAEQPPRQPAPPEFRGDGKVENFALLRRDEPDHQKPCNRSVDSDHMEVVR